MLAAVRGRTDTGADAIVLRVECAGCSALIQHARYFILQLVESHLTWSLFRQILQRIERLAWHPTCAFHVADPEVVENRNAIAPEQDVRRFHVAMDNAA